MSRLLAGQTGGYWDAPNVPAKANKNAYDPAAQERLWDVSEQLVKAAEYSLD